MITPQHVGRPCDEVAPVASKVGHILRPIRQPRRPRPWETLLPSGQRLPAGVVIVKK